MSDHFANFLTLSDEIGGLVRHQCNLVAEALRTQFDFIKLTTITQKPADNKLIELLKPTSNIILDIIVKMESFF